jgi:hypothetical protein
MAEHCGGKHRSRPPGRHFGGLGQELGASAFQS